MYYMSKNIFGTRKLPCMCHSIPAFALHPSSPLLHTAHGWTEHSIYVHCIGLSLSDAPAGALEQIRTFTASIQCSPSSAVNLFQNFRKKRTGNKIIFFVPWRSVSLLHTNQQRPLTHKSSMARRGYGSLASREQHTYAPHETESCRADSPMDSVGDGHGRISALFKAWRAVLLATILVGGVMFVSRAMSTSIMPESGRNGNDGSSTGGSFAQMDNTPPARAKSSLVAGVPAGSVSSPLSFTALNFYHVRDGKPGAQYPWLSNYKLVEPHIQTSLVVTEPRYGFQYRWEVRDPLSGEVHVQAEGAETEVYFTHLERNRVILEEKDSGGRITRRLEEDVLVKYVRREIRSLTDKDRDDLFDAVSSEFHGRLVRTISVKNSPRRLQRVQFEGPQFETGVAA